MSRDFGFAVLTQLRKFRKAQVQGATFQEMQQVHQFGLRVRMWQLGQFGFHFIQKQTDDIREVFSAKFRPKNFHPVPVDHFTPLVATWRCSVKNPKQISSVAVEKIKSKLSPRFK